MTCSAARRLQGRQSLKVILSEERRERSESGCARKPEPIGTPAARTAASIVTVENVLCLMGMASVSMVIWVVL